MYFKLVLENGHVGAGKSIESVRYLKGISTAEVFEAAARIPRVKGKDRGTGVKMVMPVSRDEYLEGLKQNARDPYLKVRKKNGRAKRKRNVLFH